MSGDPRWGLYVHVPWCRRRCPYCAFYVEVDRDADQVAFRRRVEGELAARRAPFDALGSPTSLFFGGGTPSRLDPEHVAAVIQAADLAVDAEVSLEANPEDLDPARLDALREAGVTRLSIGLQTFDPSFARLLNRASTVRGAVEAVGHARAAGFASFSVDLIFALPDQTMAHLDRELDALLGVEPPHVALYGLTFEEGTPFGRAHAAGRMRGIDDETWRAMYERIAERLRGAGLRRYEISNYARPGHESRHNRLYWTDRPYLGLGPSAHSYAPNGERWHNVANLGAYLARPDPTEDLEAADPLGRAVDRLLAGLRAAEGVPLDRVCRDGVSLPDAAIVPLVDQGLLRRERGRLILTDSGVAVADAITARLAEALRIDPSMR